ncbi:MAG TPA: hypothetical protein DEQ43_01175 [Nocardioides bacterium]|uniref:hypothetical protein n=1 Tax=uncultured Nocardioides sp. TaxID=198441 RepID=UPI000EC6A583|nr:hypothetical protein [uncultured Nocardioides sp.]HCB02873.1 hypothetical protein [Nocardioides sp.]HRD61461.1 hypothetical protein [Nocardioides sp.]HRK46249.1 hypothetical protein [Nocardioides sp.]
MSRRTTLITVIAAAVVAAAVGGLAALVWSGDDPAAQAAASPTGSVDPSTVAATSFPDLAAPTGEPTLAGIDTAAPPSGTVVTVPGPFDDRFTLSDVTVADGVVSGSLTVVSDVSEILELQVLAGFYDDRGDFLGTGRAVFHLQEEEGHSHEEAGSPNETESFRIRAPKAVAGQTVAAAIGVPVLVNE